MSTRLRQAWEARAPRERTVIAVVAIIFSAGLYLWLVQAASQAQTRLSASVTIQRMQAARLDQQAAEVERLRAAPLTVTPVADLRGRVEAQAAMAGISGALVKIESPNASQVELVFGAVAFADWLNWVASLSSQHIRLDACRIEALPAAGMVSVSATLRQATPQ